MPLDAFNIIFVSPSIPISAFIQKVLLTLFLVVLFQVSKARQNLIDSQGTSIAKGTGLGLLLCKDFAEQHDGKHGVTSKQGEGSSFYFTLPKA